MIKRASLVLFVLVFLALFISGVSIIINSPQDNAVYFTNTNIIFNVTLSENGTCWYLINSGENISMASSDNINFYSVNSTLQAGSYNITFYCNYTLGNLTQSNRSFSVIVMNISLNSPSNNFYTNRQSRNFNCSALTYDADFSNITLMVWNSSGALINSTMQEFLGKDNSTILQYNFTSNALHYWNCMVYNNNSISSMASSNFSITYDTGNPTTTLISPADNNEDYEEDESVPFKYNVTDSFDIDYCTLFIDGTAKKNDTSVNRNNEETITYIFSSSGSYDWKIRCYDKAGNYDDSSERTIEIQSADDSGRSSRSSDDKHYLEAIANYRAEKDEKETTMSTSASVIYLNKTQMSDGYTKEFKSDDVIMFVLEVEKEANTTNATTNETIKSKIKVNESHSIHIEEITNITVNLTIRSSPINFVLKIGEEKKLNLTSAEKYDLYLKLNNINTTSLKANLTIKQIDEMIKKPGIMAFISGKISACWNSVKNFVVKYRLWIFVAIGVILALVIIGTVEYFIIKKRIRESDVKIKPERHKK